MKCYGFRLHGVIQRRRSGTEILFLNPLFLAKVRTRAVF